MTTGWVTCCLGATAPADLSAGFLAAAASFPRGPGFYFHLGKLALLLLVFFAWVRTCAWVQRDAGELNVNPHAWNSVLLGVGLLGLLLVWASSAFGLGLVAMLLLYAAATLAYAYTHDQRVPVEQRLLTENNLRELVWRCLTLKFAPPRPEAPATQEVSVRLIGRSTGERQADAVYARRVGGAKAYKAVQKIVADAVGQRASHVHFEPGKKKMRVSFDVDGAGRPGEAFNQATGDAMLNIIQILSAQDTTQKGKPQEGLFSAEVEGHALDLLVMSDGEKMTLRLLDRSRPPPELGELGMRDRVCDQVRALLKQGRGMLLVCGPADSGKTTTMYACLNELDRQQQKVITVEEPVRYHLSDLTQVEVNRKLGRSFASELRAALREKPAVVLVGQLPDRDTATLACQAAQGGQLVLAAVDADDTVGALGRLLGLGVPQALVAGAVTGVLSQRLVRVLCPKCKVRYKPNPDLLRKANLPADKIKFFYRPRGDEPKEDESAGAPEVCERCGGAGYHERTGVFELLLVTDRGRELIQASPDLTALKQDAVKGGMRYLYEDGIRQVVDGNTSIQELMRVCK